MLSRRRIRYTPTNSSNIVSIVVTKFSCLLSRLSTIKALSDVSFPYPSGCMTGMEIWEKPASIKSFFACGMYSEKDFPFLVKDSWYFFRKCLAERSFEVLMNDLVMINKISMRIMFN